MKQIKPIYTFIHDLLLTVSTKIVRCFFRTKDLRPEAKNFEVFFVHTVTQTPKSSTFICD